MKKLYKLYKLAFGKMKFGFILLTLLFSSIFSDVLVSVQDPFFEDLRRIQSRNGTVFNHQNGPFLVKDVKEYTTLNKVNNYEEYQLKFRHPFALNSLVKWSDPAQHRSFYFSPLMLADFQDTASTNFLSGFGIRMFGQLTEKLSYYTNGRIFTEWSDSAQFTHQFSPQLGETCSVEQSSNSNLENSQTCARFEYYLNLNLGWAQFKLGRDHLHMSPGYFTSLTSSRNTSPYYLFQATIPFSDWLQIDNYVIKMTDTDHAIQKYAHIHRYEFKPINSLSIAFQDVVIYQDRDVDPAYIVPLIPLAFSEDNTGGRDNDAMSFDFLYTGIPFFSVWGEFFIDDLVGPTTIFDDNWENRWALLSGFQIVSPWDHFDGDLTLEFSRVEPWTYNGRQSYTSFRHFNAPSASKLGPDSRTLDLQLTYRPLKFLQIKEGMEFNKKGTQEGAILGTIHNDGVHGKSKEFLLGNNISQQIFHHEIRLFFKQYLSLEGGMTQVLGDNSNIHFNLNLWLSW